MELEEVDAVEAAEAVNYLYDLNDEAKIAGVIRHRKVRFFAARVAVLSLAAWIALYVLAAPATLQAIGVVVPSPGWAGSGPLPSQFGFGLATR